ncbi:MAG: hypothetical protein WCE76_29725, partial [Mycobacterium sp.]
MNLSGATSQAPRQRDAAVTFDAERDCSVTLGRDGGGADAALATHLAGDFAAGGVPGGDVAEHHRA